MFFNTDAYAARLRSWWEHTVLLEPKDWIQVEVTSSCNAACSYCPRTVYGRNWQDRFMPLETFERLMPSLRRTSLAYLQGWGEPFLHPDLPAMIRLAKTAGCKVGTTTNGMLLTGERILQVMEAGLDILAFSLAGTTPACNDTARAGTSLSKVLEKMDLVRQIRESGQRDTPQVHIAYMLLRSGLKDLDGLPRLMADHGVSQAVISVLDFEPGIALSQEVLAPRTEQARHALADRLTALQKAGADLGVTIHTPCFDPNGVQGTVCSENIERALFIAADGAVSPCVYANLPVDEVGCVRQGHALSYRRMTFGNVIDQPLPVIWRTKAYADFRNSLAAGRPVEICRDCPKREQRSMN